MDRRILGPQGVPVIGGAQQPASPFIDIRQGDENGPMYRLPVVALGFIPPDQLDALARAIAPAIAQVILDTIKGSAGLVEKPPE